MPNRVAHAVAVMALALVPLDALAQIAQPHASPSTAPFDAAKARAITAIARAELHAGTTPGMAIAVVQDGLLVYARGFGYADLQKHLRAGPTTQFFAGSISKQFTAAAVLLLAQDHKLSLGDPVTKYVPELSVGKGVSIAQLLQQTSGLPDYTKAPGMTHDPVKPFKLDDLVRAVDQMKPAAVPGAQFEYNNFNYMIVGLIVERVTALPLSVFMQSRIFEPLIMDSTLLAGDQGISPGHARGYTRMSGRFVAVKPWNPSWLFGAGDIITTADDLAKWDVGLPLLLNVDSIRSMWTPGTASGTQYGMGWVIDQRGGQRYVWHNGELAGYHAMNALLPDQHVAVIVLTNADSLGTRTTVSPERLANRVLDVVAPLPPAQFGNLTVQRAAEWIGRLQRIDIDRTQLTPSFSQYLTDQVIIKADLKSLGPVTSLVPIESYDRSGDTVYVFDAKFGRATLRYSFALAPGGKIDELLFAP